MDRRIAVFPAVAIGLAGLAPASHADAPTVAGNLTVTSQYVFRGLTQTSERPAVQGGLDVTHTSGLYAGTWLSNVSWFSDTNAGTSNSLEWDLYGGYRRPVGDVTLDAGVLRYQYPGHYPGLPAGTVKPHTTELYAGATWKWLSAKYSYALSDTFGVEDSRGTDYIDVSVTVPIDDELSLLAHAGRQSYAGYVVQGRNLGDAHVAAGIAAAF